MFGQQPLNQGANPSTNPRLAIATQSLNKNADGYVVCINNTHNDIQKGHFESRIEWIRQGRPNRGGMPGAAPQGFGQQAAPAAGGGLFGGLSNQNQQPTGFFGGAPAAPQGGPLANPAQPSAFSLTPNNPPPTFGAQQGLLGGNTANTGLFGQPAQPANPQGGGIFGGLGQAAPAGGGGGLFGAPQATPAFGQNFGGLGQNNQQAGQITLGQTLQPQNGMFGGLQPQTGQMFQQGGGLNNIQQPNPLNNNQGQQQVQQVQMVQYVDPTTTQEYREAEEKQKIYLKEIEEHFNYNYQPLAFNQQQNVVPLKTDAHKIEIRRKNESNRIQQRSSILQRNTSNLSTQSQRSSIQSFFQYTLEREKQNSKIKSQQQSSIIINQNSQRQQSFQLSCQSMKIRRIVSLEELKIAPKQLSSYTVEYLIEGIKRNILKSDENYALTYQQGEEPLQGLSNDVTLDNLKFNDQTIIQVIPLKSAKPNVKTKNPRAPILADVGYVTSPSMLELLYMDDQALSSVENFVIDSKYAKVEFLSPVDLRNIKLHELVILEQDCVQFYPDPYVSPPVGHEINVPCRILFKNFGSGTPSSNALKKNDFETFQERAYEWTQANNMIFESIDENSLIVTLDQLGSIQ